MGAQPAESGSRVLVVDDEPALLRALEALLVREGHRVVALDHPVAALHRLTAEDFDVALVDIKMPELSGLELLNAVKFRRPEVEVIIMTGQATWETARQALKAGAFDYLTKPFEDVELVALTVRKAARFKAALDKALQLEARLREREPGAGVVIVGSSPKMLEVTRMVDAVAASDASVLVTGESGTGKELVARELHQKSSRARERFIAFNCAALTETLLESELFGHVKGSFTGAQRDHRGLFDAANRGTIFLDEIGDIAPSTQVRLLRVLQEGEFKRVGANDTTKVDVRVVAATHRDLSKLVKSGKFREDLYYRLNVINIAIPPLRERVEDVPLLAHHFLHRYSERLGKKVRAFAPEAIDALTGYRWPGNVRELENAVERAVVLCRGESVEVRDLPPAVAGRAAPLVQEPPAGAEEASWMALSYANAKDQALRRFEKGYVEALMRACENNISAAARRAGMDRSNFKRVLRKYRGDLEDDEGEEDQPAAEG